MANLVKKFAKNEDAQTAFSDAITARNQMWDALRQLEQIIGVEVETSDILDREDSEEDFTILLGSVEDNPEAS